MPKKKRVSTLDASSSFKSLFDRRVGNYKIYSLIRIMYCFLLTHLIEVPCNVRSNFRGLGQQYDFKTILNQGQYIPQEKSFFKKKKSMEKSPINFTIELSGEDTHNCQHILFHTYSISNTVNITRYLVPLIFILNTYQYQICISNCLIF